MLCQFHVLISITGNSQWIAILCYRFIVYHTKLSDLESIDVIFNQKEHEPECALGITTNLASLNHSGKVIWYLKWKISSFQVFTTSEVSYYADIVFSILCIILLLSCRYSQVSMPNISSFRYDMQILLYNSELWYIPCWHKTDIWILK